MQRGNLAVKFMLNEGNSTDDNQVVAAALKLAVESLIGDVDVNVIKNPGSVAYAYVDGDLVEPVVTVNLSFSTGTHMSIDYLKRQFAEILQKELGGRAFTFY